MTEMTKEAKRMLDSGRVRGTEDLCLLVRRMGCTNVVDQLQCRNGAFLSDLMAFLDDNEGAVGALVEWIEETYGDDMEDDEDDPEEEEGE